jgi:hypothetical protein
MGLTYFKRFRMEIDLVGRSFPVHIPRGYVALPWDRSLLEAHAEAKYLSFHSEIDANVFPCLGEPAGCQRLMNEISRRDGFLPEATWLLAWEGGSEREYCGTIQGIRDQHRFGAIQNLGIVAEHRGHGLGSALMHLALSGFQQVGLRRAFLEVTAQNEGAIRLYRRLGFTKVRTVYKCSEVAFT